MLSAICPTTFSSGGNQITLMGPTRNIKHTIFLFQHYLSLSTNFFSQFLTWFIPLHLSLFQQILSIHVKMVEYLDMI
jgi:hypothetical protein